MAFVAAQSRIVSSAPATATTARAATTAGKPTTTTR